MSPGTARADLTRSAMAGASTGGRTFTALAAQALTARPDAAGQPDAALAAPWAKGLIGFLALTELVLDKLPATPSRLEFPGLSGRIVAGAACGAIIARREPDPGLTGWPTDTALEIDPTALPADPSDARARTVACALAGAAAAAAASWAGTRWRSSASSAVGRDWVGAVVEDAATVGLAAAAAHPR